MQISWYEMMNINILSICRGKRYDVTPEIKEILEVVSQDQNNNNKSSGKVFWIKLQTLRNPFDKRTLISTSNVTYYNISLLNNWYFVGISKEVLKPAVLITILFFFQVWYCYLIQSTLYRALVYYCNRMHQCLQAY